MAYPTLTLEFSPTTDPATTPVWVDITSYMREAHTRRGRQRELDRDEAGTMTVRLDNTTRIFDPSYAAGAYYGYLKPMRRIRLSATLSGVTYRLFTGFIDGFPQSWPFAGVGECIINATDGWKILSMRKLNATYSSELSSVRIANVLNGVGWTGSYWILDNTAQSVLGTTTILAGSEDDSWNLATGLTTVQASTLANVGATDHITLVVQAENGRSFVRGDGVFVFLARDSHSKSPYDVAKGIFGDNQSSELPYQNLVPSTDDINVYGEVRITNISGIEQVATDATSNQQYFQRTLARSGQLMTTDVEALNAANYLLGRYKQPGLWIRSMNLEPTGNDSMFPVLLSCELADRLTVNRRPFGGAAISQDSYIEGIKHDIFEGQQWRASMNLSPAAIDAHWVLDSTTNSQLGLTTVLTY